MKKALTAVMAAALLVGCGNADETYRPERYTADKKDENKFYAENSATAQTSHSESVTQSTASAAFVPATNGEMRQTFLSDGDTLAYIAENLFSNGEYFTVVASAKKTETETDSTIYINGKLYEAPMLTLYQGRRILDTVTPDIPEGDRFITLESAADSYYYGGEVISNMREFGAAEYPDILGLVFRSGSPEAAVPEYARYFAVFDGKLAELSIYENGSRVSPRGTKLEPSSVGVAKQFLTVRKSGGGGYEVIKYEYHFDVENRRLTRKQVKFYGWEY